MQSGTAEKGSGMSPLSTPRKALRLVVADDHTVVRQAVTTVLEKNAFHIVGEASDGRTAVSLCATLQPDVAILDIVMPMLNGIDAARRIFRVCPRTKIAVLSAYAEEPYVRASLRAGITGYVVKSEAAEMLVEAIEAISKGEVYLSPAVARLVAQGLRGTGSPASALGLREREVLQLIVEGKSTDQIGDLLGISTRTAYTYRARIMRKLNIHNVAGLVQCAIKKGLVGFVH